MAQKNTIGLVFAHNENWIGGTYYILNLIQALKTLPTEQQPTLVVFLGKPEDALPIEEIQYPKISFQTLNVKHGLIIKLCNKISQKLFKTNIIKIKYKTNQIQTIFPYDLQEGLADVPQKINWIPDFQEYHMKNFFSAENLKVRGEYQRTIVKQKIPIVFSSEDAQNDFWKIYPQAQNLTKVINFATTHPTYQHLDIKTLKEKYGINQSYIISPNQFWKHKNHKIILETIQALNKSKNIDFQIVFTGKEYDFRYPDYAEGLKNFVREYNLQEQIKFLGFIDRREQLQLMNHALAVLQPSLFEGWSTVVEDAKAMNQYIIASDINVHQEQLKNYPNKTFFNPQNYIDLLQKIESLNLQELQKIPYDYGQYITKFALDFMNLVTQKN